MSQLQNHHYACASAEAPEAEPVRAAEIFWSLMGVRNVVVRLAILLLLVGASAGLAEESGSSLLEQRGRALAERMCSQCHATARVVRARTLVLLPLVRSIAAWISILSRSDCARASRSAIRICRPFVSRAKTRVRSCFI